MRKPNFTYAILPLANGAVIAFQSFGTIEYLGSDGLWLRHPDNCIPFADEATAKQKLEQIEEEH